MPVSEFSHEGTTYNFDPPIETGNRTAQDLAELVAIAKEGPEVPDGGLRVARLTAQLVLRGSESDQLSTLNSLLHGSHQVTIA